MIFESDELTVDRYREIASGVLSGDNFSVDSDLLSVSGDGVVVGVNRVNVVSVDNEVEVVVVELSVAEFEFDDNAAEEVVESDGDELAVGDDFDDTEAVELAVAVPVKVVVYFGAVVTARVEAVMLKGRAHVVEAAEDVDSLLWVGNLRFNDSHCDNLLRFSMCYLAALVASFRRSSSVPCCFYRVSLIYTLIITGIVCFVNRFNKEF